MNCTIACSEPLQAYKKVGVLTALIKWLKTIKVDGAEQMSKTK